MTGAQAIGAGIAAADHHHLLSRGEDRLDVAKRLARDPAVLLRQEIHRIMHTAQIAALDGKVARMLGAAGEQHEHQAREAPGQASAGGRRG